MAYECMSGNNINSSYRRWMSCVSAAAACCAEEGALEKQMVPDCSVAGEQGVYPVFIAKITSFRARVALPQECIVDEDCGPDGYCNLSDFTYRCFQCKEEDTALCSRDGECCRDQICVWGQCQKSSKGQSGTVCESQQDCGPGLCCAVHASLLFPVCTPLPIKGEECQPPNPLLDLLTWSLEPEAPSSYCPCASGLLCQPQGYGSISVCKEPSEQNKRDDPPELAPFTAMPQVDMFYEDGDIMPTEFSIDPGASDNEREAELNPEPHFVDYI